MREFWDLVQRPLQITPDMVLKFAGAGVKGIQDLPHCEHLPEGTRICFVRANEARPRLGSCLLRALAGPHTVSLKHALDQQ